MTVSAVNATGMPQSVPLEPNGGTSETALLAEPGTPTKAGYGDAMAMLYSCMAKQSSLELKSGENNVAVEKGERDEAMKEENDALAREQKADGDGSKGFFASIKGLVSDVASNVEKLHLADAVGAARSDITAAWNSPNFWHDVDIGARVAADIAAVAGSTALAVATFGTGTAATVLVVASLVLSSAGTAESDFHVLEKCGVDAKVASWVGIGASGTGSILGGIGSLVADPAKVTELAKGITAAAQAYSGATDVVRGTSTIKTGSFQADALDAQADATSDDDRSKSIQRTMDLLVDGIQDMSDSHERALQTLAGAMQTHDQTLVIAGSGRMA